MPVLPIVLALLCLLFPRRHPELPPVADAAYRQLNEIPMAYVQARGEEIPARTGSFDIVVCHNVLDHTEHPLRVLSESYRVLKQNGYFILGVNTRSLLSHARWRFWERHVGRRALNIVAHPFQFTVSQIERLLACHGFAIEWIPRSRFEGLQRLVGHSRKTILVCRKRATDA